MSIRTERVEAVLQKDLGRILQKSYQQTGTFLTVTRVDISPDLMNANVFISVYAPGQDEDPIFTNLQENNAAIRQTLAAKIRNQVRRIPELNLKMDKSAERAQQMENLFDQIHKNESTSHDEQE